MEIISGNIREFNGKVKCDYFLRGLYVVVNTAGYTL